MNDELMAKIKQSMLAGDKPRTEALKLLKASVLKARIDSGVEIDDHKFVDIVQKEIKQRQDSVEIYKKINDKIRIDKELYEINVLNEFLPNQLSVEEIEKIIKDVIADNNIELEQSSFGKIFGLVKQKVGASSDGQTISGSIKKILSDK